MLNMNGKDLDNPNSDYTDSLHYKINKSLKNQHLILSRGQELGLNTQPNRTFNCAIKFGKTKLSEYQTLAQLGKGTYGEVNKSLHTRTNTIVAIKTFFFEVSN